MKRLLIAALLCASAFPQAVQTGGTFTGSVVFGEGPTGSGPLLTYSARTDLCENAGDTGCAATPTCPTLSSTGNCNPVGCTSCSGAAMLFTNSPINGIPGSNHLPIPGPASTISCGTQGTLACNYQYPNGINTVITDPDFHTQSVRATDYSLAGVQGRAFNVGSAGTYHFWLSDDSGFFVPNTGGGYALMAFTPANWNTSAGTCTGCISASSVYGPAIAGIPSTSGTSPNLFYVFKTDQENTVFYSSLTGACSTPDVLTQASTGATATLQAINVGFVQFGIVTVSTADNTHAWSDSGSCVITPNSGYSAPPFGDSPTTGAPYANTLYKGLLNSSGLPSTWSVTYSMLFNFNYVASMTSSPAAAYFPAGANTCLPANYNGQWSGTFQNSLDDTAWSSPLSDDGQVYAWGQAQTSCSTSPGGVCTGPVYYVTYIAGHGCRTVNTHTNQITDDSYNPATNLAVNGYCSAQYPCGQELNGQRNYILGTITGTPSILFSPTSSGALLTQAVTGAQAEYKSTGSLHTGLTPPSGSYTYSQWQNSLVSPTGWEIGYIYGTPDATNCWTDGAISGSLCSGDYITPNATLQPNGPQPVPFYYPGAIHDANQNDNSITASITSGTGTATARVGQEQIGVPSAGYTTISFLKDDGSGAAKVTLNQDEQFTFYNLAGATYLNCTDANHCPAWTIKTGGVGVTSIVIVDNVAGSCANTTCVETTVPNTGPPPICSMSNAVNACPLTAPNAPGFVGNYPGFDYPEYWQIGSLITNPNSSINAQGHSAHGSVGDARAAQYWYFFVLQPSTPCLVSGYSPCPHGDTLPLLAATLTNADNHGAYENHGSGDLAPFGLATTYVCLQGTGGSQGTVGTNSCNSPFTAPFQTELLAVENTVTSNAPPQVLPITPSSGSTGNYQCGTSIGPGCHCNYGSTNYQGCTYRLGHKFDSDSSWNFNIQNGASNISYDGKYIIYPSDDLMTLGCMNGATNCWSPYIASGPGNVYQTTVAWSTDASGVVTFTVPNYFCPLNGNQYYWTNSAVQTVACGSQAEQIVLTGFASTSAHPPTSGALSWIPDGTTLTITANVLNAWGCNSTTSAAGLCTAFTGTISGAPISSSGTVVGTVLEPSGNGSLQMTPNQCNSGPGANTYCQRADIWVANLQTAH